MKSANVELIFFGKMLYYCRESITLTKTNPPQPAARRRIFFMRFAQIYGRVSYIL